MQLTINDGYAEWIIEYDIPSEKITAIKLADDETAYSINDFTEIELLHYNRIAHEAYMEAKE